MALNFPSSPIDGQVYYDTTSGNRYIYNSATTSWKYAANNDPASSSSNTQVLYNANGGVIGSPGLTFSANTLYTNTVNVSENVTAQYFHGNGAALTGIVTDFSPAFNVANSAFDKANNAMPTTSNGTQLVFSQSIPLVGPNLSNTAGERIIFWPQRPGGAYYNYSFGLEQDAIWFGVDTGLATKGFTWYSGNTKIMELTRNANLTVNFINTNNIKFGDNTVQTTAFRYDLANLAFDTANAAFYKANNALANTDNVVFSGNLRVTGNVYVGTSTVTITNDSVTATNIIATNLTVNGSAVPSGVVSNLSFDTANAAFDKANAANVLAYNTGIGANNYAGAMANSANAYAASLTPDLSPAFNKANAAYTVANASYDFANNVNTFAYGVAVNAAAAFASANNVAPQVKPSFDTANAAFTSANTAGSLANQAGVIANAAYGEANNSYTFGNTVYAAVNSVFGVANAAFTSANNVAPQVAPAFNTANAAFGAANQAGVVANNANTYAGSTFVKLTAGSQTITGDLAITGNLTFTGNAVIISSNTLAVGDSLIYLAANNYSGTDTLPIGFIANYGNTTGSNVHSGLVRNPSDKEYYLFNGYDIEPGTNNQINFGANNMVNAVLVADFNTSNLTLGGANAIVWIKSSYDNANAAYGNANSVASSANNYAGVMANSSNGYAVTVGASGNNYAGVMANSVNNYTSATYATQTTVATNATSANNYAGAMANSVNAYTSATYATSTTVSTGLTSANNYAGAMANSANAYATATYATITTVATNATSANNYAGAMANAANTWANNKVDTITSNSTSRIWANSVVVSGVETVYLDLATSGVTASSYSSGISAITVDAYGRVTSVTGSAGYVSGSFLANTSGVAFNGNLNFPTGNVFVGTNTTIATNGSILFTQANPYITASSYTTFPGGIYVSGGTLYAQNSLKARGGVANDTGAYLTIDGGTSGITYFNSTIGIGNTSPVANLQVNSSTKAVLIGATGTYSPGFSANAGFTVSSPNGGASSNWYDPSNYAGFIFNNTNAAQRYGLLVADLWRSSENFVFAVDGRYSVDGSVANDTHNPYLIVRGDGNVGIGTAAPGYALDVKGQVNCSAILVNGTTYPSGATITNDTAGSTTLYPVCTNATSGTMSVANTSSTKLTYVPSTGTLSATVMTSTSDINKKENLKLVDDPIEVLQKLNGYSFDWKDNKKPSLGVIAQEVEKVLPCLVEENDDGKSVNYNGLIAILLEAIKDQQKQIDDLKEKLI